MVNSRSCYRLAGFFFRYSNLKIAILSLLGVLLLSLAVVAQIGNTPPALSKEFKERATEAFDEIESASAEVSSPQLVFKIQYLRANSLTKGLRRRASNEIERALAEKMATYLWVVNMCQVQVQTLHAASAPPPKCIDELSAERDRAATAGGITPLGSAKQ